MRQMLFGLVLLTTTSTLCLAQAPVPSSEPFNTASLDALSPQDRESIVQILRGFKLLPSNDVSVLNGRRPQYTSITAASIGGQACQVGCDIAAIAARAFCLRFQGPVVVVCQGAVEAAHQYCLNQCPQ
jgi:hypothetical protein